MAFSRYDGLARFYDLILSPIEKRVIDPLRRRYAPMIQGLTLDIASGTGHNIKYYPPGARVFLLDKSRKMLELSRRKAAGISNGLKLEFVLGEIEEMPFHSDSFDTVLSIDVLCSVRDVAVSLEQIKRVLKPGGKVIFVEHGRTGRKFKDFSLALLNVITYTTVGSSMTREPLKAIEKTGFVIREIEELSGSFKYILCGKDCY